MAGTTPKTMSKGLMGMKFMQRAAAKSSAASSSTPNGPPAKKARLSNGAPASGISDQDIIQSGLDAEEARHQAALDRAAQHAGDTKWVLSFQDPLEGKRQDVLNVRHAGYAEIDAEDDSEEDEEDARPVRMQFGGGVKRTDTSVPMVKAEDSKSEGETSSDDDDSDDDSDDAAADLIRQTKREMAAEKREAKKKRTSMGNTTPKATPTRQDENRNLSGLTSISGGRRSGGGGLSGGSGRMNNMECFKCGEIGHMAMNCSKPSAPRGSSGRGSGKGRR